MNSENVAVVIIGRNEGNRLIRCLKSTVAISDCVIYVDSGSIDNSVQNAKQMGAVVVELDEIQPFTAARARNAGFLELRKIRPDIHFIQFVDGDCEIVDGWLSCAIDFFVSHPDVAAVYGRRKERHPEISVYNRLCDDEWDTPIGESLSCGGDSLMRVSPLNEVGGFRSDLICGEEPELCVRLRENGWKIWRLNADMTIHDAAITHFRQWWTRSVRGGYGFAEVSQLHRHSRYGIWRRETFRATFWGGVLPLLITLSALIHPFSLWGFAIYPLQVIRISVRRNFMNSQSWVYALFMMLVKFAEFQGVLKYYWRRWNGQTAHLIEYKR